MARTRGQFLSPRYIRFVSQTLFFAPLLVGAVAGWLLASVYQMREIYVGIVEDGDILRGVLGLCVIMLFSAHLYAWNANTADRRIDAIYPDHLDIEFDRRVFRMRNVKALICAVLPLLGLVWGLAAMTSETTRAVGNVKAIELALMKERSGVWLSPIEAVQRPAELTTFVAFAACFAFLCLLHTLRDEARLQWIRWSTAALGTATIALPLLWPDWAAAAFVALGPLAGTGLVLLGATVILKVALWIMARLFQYVLRIAASMLMAVTSFKAAVPITVVIVLIGFALAIHLQVFTRHESVSKAGVSELLRNVPLASNTLESQFEAWLSKRPSRKPEKSYPVFIVAAQGGGIYAASAAAIVLTALQERCPEFAEHVFAISAVSGGAVGAAIFHAALDAAPLPPTTTCYEHDVGPGGTNASSIAAIAEGVIRDDHLSPVLSYILPDLVSDVLAPRGLRDFAQAKYPGYFAAGDKQNDRADRLEWSLTRSFAAGFTGPGPSRKPKCPGEKTGRAGLDNPYDLHWCPVSTAPALVLNTTWVETGFRVPFAPFPLYHAGDQTLVSTKDLASIQKYKSTMSNIGKKPLAEAAVASARFPLIAPPWSIRKETPEGGWWNFVDGGYADNSGAATALDLYKKLNPIAESRGAKLHMILLTDALADPDLDNLRGDLLSDLTSPVKAVIKVRELLARQAVTRAKHEVPLLKGGNIHWIELDHHTFKLPLGWKISGTSNSIVKLMMGQPEILPKEEESRIIQCRYKDAVPPETPDHVAQAVRTIRHNSCTLRNILEDLKKKDASAPAVTSHPVSPGPT